MMLSEKKKKMWKHFTGNREMRQHRHFQSKPALLPECKEMERNDFRFIVSNGIRSCTHGFLRSCLPFKEKKVSFSISRFLRMPFVRFKPMDKARRCKTELPLL